MDIDDNQVITQIEEEIQNSDPVGKVSLILHELKNQNFNVRLFCIKNLKMISELIGPDRTAEELIPMLIDHIINFEENEEVLLEIANALYDFSPFFIRDPSHLPVVIRGLEMLMGNDDETVRQQATDNLCKLITRIDDNLIKNEIFPLMQRLIQNDMKSKISCCYLFPVVYPILNEESIKRELIHAYFDISKDDSPSVRRAAAHNIKFFALIDEDDLTKDLISLYTDLLKDPVDIVKVFAVESTHNLLQRLDSVSAQKIINTFTTSLSKDRSWRVKYAVSECICEISSRFNGEFNETNFLPVLLLFLKDSEAEVRASVISKLPNFLPHLPSDKLASSILPIFQDNINSDHNHHVRSLFASTLLKCSQYFNETVFEKNIFPILNKLIKDDIIEVKIAAVSGLGELLPFFNSERIMRNCVHQIVTEISKESKWRLRLTLAEQILKIVTDCPKDQFTSYFLPTVYKFFNDHAYQIREIVYEILDTFCKCQENKNFAKDNLWDLQRVSLDSKNYIMRVSSMKSIEKLKNNYPSDFLICTVIPTLNKIVRNENVPNVKFCFCNIIPELLELCKGETQVEQKFISEVAQILENLTKDADSDVKHFAGVALNKIK